MLGLFFEPTQVLEPFIPKEPVIMKLRALAPEFPERALWGSSGGEWLREGVDREVREHDTGAHRDRDGGGRDRLPVCTVIKKNMAGMPRRSPVQQEPQSIPKYVQK